LKQKVNLCRSLLFTRCVEAFSTLRGIFSLPKFFAMEFKNAISWFEIPVTDFARAKTFYQKIFDAQLEEMEMGPVRMGMFPADAENGGVGGAICFGEGYAPAGPNGPKVYLNAGDDLNTVLNRVAGAGGKVIVPKTEIAPGMGQFAFFNDSEGNVVGLYSMD